MNKLQELLDLLSKMEEVDTVRTLKKAIEDSPTLLADYQKMLQLQKRLVRETVDGMNSSAIQTKAAVDALRLKLEGHPIVNEYMNGLSSIQETIDLIIDILRQEITNQ